MQCRGDERLDAGQAGGASPPQAVRIVGSLRTPGHTTHAQTPVDAQLAPEDLTIEQLDEAPRPHWVWVNDLSWNHMPDGRAFLMLGDERNQSAKGLEISSSAARIYRTHCLRSIVGETLVRCHSPRRLPR